MPNHTIARLNRDSSEQLHSNAPLESVGVEYVSLQST